MRHVHAIAAVALLGASAFAQEPEKVTLKTRYREGDAYSVAFVLRMNVEGTVEGLPTGMTEESIQEYREEILLVKDGRPVKAERRYATYTDRHERRTGAPAKTDEDLPPETETETSENPIVGKTLTLVDKDGKMRLEEEPEEGELEEDELQIGADFEMFLPAMPVSTGEQWTVPREKLAALLGHADELPKNITTNCVLESVEETAGTRLARIRIKISIEHEEEGAKITAALDGLLLMDLTAGRVLSVSLKGTTKTDHPMMTLEGPMECQVTVTPIK